MATDHHSEEKYDRSRAKITLTTNQTKPTILKDELEGIFPVTVLSPPLKWRYACMSSLACMDYFNVEFVAFNIKKATSKATSSEK